VSAAWPARLDWAHDQPVAPPGGRESAG
jgi:hypothetical protein